MTFDLPQKSNVLLWRGRLFHQNAFLGPESEKRTTQSLWLFMTFQHENNSDALFYRQYLCNKLHPAVLCPGLKYFLSSTYQSDYMMSTIWNKPANRYLDHSVSDVLHSFHVPQLQCLYLSVLLTNQDVDSNTVFTLILLLQILRIHSPFWLALTLSVLQRLSHLRLQSALSSTLWGLFVFRLPGAGRNKGLSELSKILVIFTRRIRHC